MKKRIIMGFIVFAIEINVAFSYQIVNDFLHMLETIHNGAQMYQQIQNEIKELEYEYQSAKSQIKSLQQLDPSDIHSFTDAVEAVDVNLTFLRNTEDTLTNYRVSLGDTSYNLAEIYKIPGGVYSEVYDAWASDLSDEDKARIWSYYGLDPRNYVYTQTWKKRISGASKQLSILAQQANKQLEQNENQTQKDQEESNLIDSTEGLVGQQQLTNHKLQTLGKDLDTLSYTMAQTGDLLASSIQSDIYIESEINVSSDFTEISAEPEPIEIEGIY